MTKKTSKENLKRCSKCHQYKDESKDFYVCLGTIRGECKKCTVKRNVSYQKKNKSWRNRFVDEERQRSYMVDYYAKNKEKFAEYKRKFKEKNPDYFREWHMRKKEQ